MKTKRKMLGNFAALCSLVVATAAVGQTARVWDGGDGTGTNLGAATNWVGDTLPQTPGGTIGDFATFDGLVPGNLALTYNGGLGSGFQQPGVNWDLTPNQNGSVTIVSPVAASANLAVGNFMTNRTANASLQFGDNSSSVLNIIWRSTPADPPYDPHWLINNSASPIVIRPNVRFQAGGGNTHIIVFGGTGNWHITNNLTTANGVGTTLRKIDSGTLVWGGPSIGGALGNSTINSPVDIQGGTVVLKNSGLLGTQRITNNGALLQLDIGTQSQTLSGPIHGAGELRVSSGTLTLSSGQSDFTGNVVVDGTGTLVVSGGENPGVTGPLGVGGTISFQGGTLQFSVNNTFDYSARFSAAAGQNYRIDTAGQAVILGTGLGSSGGTFTKLGAGTLTLTGDSSYSGLTVVNAGRLVFQGSKTGSGDIVVSNSAALGVTATGTQVTPANLTLGSTSGATLEFNNITSTATAPLAAGAFSAGGTITINVNSGTFSAGSSYPLLTWTSGAAPTVDLGVLNGAGGNLSISGNTLYLNVTSLAYVWTGAADGNWNTTTVNWIAAGNQTTFVNGNTALFDDTATGQTNITLTELITPLGVTVNSSANPYSIASAGANLIGGTGGLTKVGNSTLTLQGGVNTYTGPTTISGGAINASTLANGGSPSDIGSSGSGAASLVLNGGSLLYTGPGATVDRLFSVGTGGGTLNASGSGALILNNAGAVTMSGSGARVLTLSGNNLEDNILAASLSDNGGATSLAKNGTGKWVVTADNSHSGATTIANGTLQVGAGGASGTLGTGNITVNGSLIFNRTGSVTNGTVSGTGSLTVSGGGTVVLPGNNAYSGGTTVGGGTTLQVGVGGATGSLDSGSAIVNDGTLIFDSTTPFNIAGFGANITGFGNLVKRGSGLLKIIGNNTYSGWTLIEAGATLQVSEGNQGQFASSVVTNHGRLLMTRQDDNVFNYAGTIVGTGAVVKDNNNQNFGVVTLTGSNAYTGGTFIGGGAIRVGDTGINGWIEGDVIFTNSISAFNDNNRQIIFSRGDDVTFSGFIGGGVDLPLGTRGQLVQEGFGVLTLTGNNQYFGGTLINMGTLQVGNGGTSGAIGTGPVTVNGTLVWNRSDDLTFGGLISGSGAVVKKGTGTVTLTATNTYFGFTVVSNGTLAIASGIVPGELFVEGGKFAGGAPGEVVTNRIAGSITFNAGALGVTINKSLVASNTLYEPLGFVSVTSGSLEVANVGPALTVGEKFFVFNQPVANGSLLTVSGGGATWINNLETDGSITVNTVIPPAEPPTLNVSRTGNNLQFTWSGSGFKLQAQTNSLSIGITSNWADYPGGTASPVNAVVDPSQGTVFFRLVSTP